MASLSESGDTLTIRLVYDGPPESGKTSSLRTLAGSLARAIESPEEADGRTLFFDWIEYVGGSFEGLPIRCQIVSVPGQRALAPRRRALLAGADAIVFVADSTAGRFADSEKALAALCRELEGAAPPRPGIVVQANKRDAPGALPVEQLRQRLEMPGLALVESVAIAGTGIREAFVLAVRLALDRVRELRSARALRSGPPEVKGAGDLLRQLREAEAGTYPLGERRETPRAPAETAAPEKAAPPPAKLEPAGESPAHSALRQVMEEEARAEIPSEADPGDGTPRLPDSTVPSGRVWPPIEGRTLLHAASAIPAVPRLRPDGSWGTMKDGWWFHSAAEHEFGQLDSGKEELILWAQRHAGGLRRLSPQRCLVLSEAGPTSWRLWQIVQPQPALRQKLAAALRGADPSEQAATLLDVALAALRARLLFSREPPLPCVLEVIGERSGEPDYVGLLPPRLWSPPEGEAAEDEAAFLRRLLGPSIRRGLAEGGVDVPRVLNALRDEKAKESGRGPIVETLSALLIGH